MELTRPDANVALLDARVAQISMMSGLFDIASEWATKAIVMGERVGAEAVVVHALNTYGVSQICLAIDDGWAQLDESLRRATAGDLEEDIPRPSTT